MTGFKVTGETSPKNDPLKGSDHFGTQHGGVRQVAGVPQIIRALDHVLVFSEPHVDLGIPHLKNPRNDKFHRKEEKKKQHQLWGRQIPHTADSVKNVARNQILGGRCLEHSLSFLWNIHLYQLFTMAPESGKRPKMDLESDSELDKVGEFFEGYARIRAINSSRFEPPKGDNSAFYKL